MTFVQTAQATLDKPYTTDGPSVFERIDAQECLFLSTVLVPDGDYLECGDYNTALEARYQRNSWANNSGPIAYNAYVGGVDGRRPWLVLAPLDKLDRIPEVAIIHTYRGNNLIASKRVVAARTPQAA